MAAISITNARQLIDGYDVSDVTGDLDVSGEAEMLPRTPIRSGGFRQQIPGLKSYRTVTNGFADFGSATAVCNVFRSATVGNQFVVSTFPTGGDTAGDPAIFTRARLQAFRAPGGAIGTIGTFGSVFESNTAQIEDGVTLHPLTLRTSSSSGTAVEFAGPTASQKLYAALHVTSVDGTSPTLDVKVQSDDNSSFTTPTDRITFTQASAIGAQWATPLAGAITDDHWRVTWTIGGSSDPEFTFAVVIGTINN